MGVDAYIEALLFVKGAALKKSAVIKTLGLDDAAFTNGINTLRERLGRGALRLVETDQEVQLMTAPELSSFVEALQREELKKEIGKAGAETLAIILYRGPVSRAEIDAVRGVNSATILRNLLVRGLIERQVARVGGGYRFNASPELLAMLGVTRKEELQGYRDVLDQLEAFEKAVAESDA